MNPFYKSPRINIGRLTPMIQDLKGQVKFLQNTDILPTKQTCPDCKKVLSKQSSRGYFVYFRCTTCKKQISARTGTVLSDSRVRFRRIILLGKALKYQSGKIVETPTQATITKVVFNMKMSAISELLLLILFWPNFNCSFPGSSLSSDNCHRNICWVNSCPCDICPSLLNPKITNIS